ncbi:MAG: PilZ domain-containing protein [Gemmataceae bacterium]
MSLFNRLPAWMLESAWLVPAIGLVACGMAFFVGWRLLGTRSRTDDENTPLDLDFLKGVTRERRGATRRKGNTVEVILSLGDDKPDFKGWVIDRSQGGLCILVEEPVPAATVLRVKPRAGGDKVAWAEVTVRSSRPEGHQHELGCQFHRPPTYHLLLQFG